jgi:hypothetical protein
MFDFTNSDGRLTGQDIPGVLPTDRRNQFKFFGNYQLGNLMIGLSWTPTSGPPITDLLDHPAYKNAGEIPVCPDGTFTCPGGPRGAEGRTPWIFPVNLHGEYTIHAGERARIKLVADLFNLFNEQSLIRVNQFSEINNSPGVSNPDFLKPYLSGVPVVFPDPYQDPFSARLAVRFEF